MKCFLIRKSRIVAAVNFSILGFLVAVSMTIGSVAGVFSPDNEQPIISFPTDERVMYITVNVYEFTDVDALHTALDSRKATLFISEEFEAKYPEKLKYLAQEGYTIGILLDDVREKNKSEIHNIIAARIERMAHIIGKNSELVRFNHNRYDGGIIEIIRNVGLYPVQWAANDTDESFSQGDIVLLTGQTDIEKFFIKTDADGFKYRSVNV